MKSQLSYSKNKEDVKRAVKKENHFYQKIVKKCNQEINYSKIDQTTFKKQKHQQKSNEQSSEIHKLNLKCVELETKNKQTQLTLQFYEKQVEKLTSQIQQDKIKYSEIKYQSSHQKHQNNKNFDYEILHQNLNLKRFINFCGNSQILQFGHKRYLFERFSRHKGDRNLLLMNTKLIYKMDLKNKTNFHEYIDENENLLILCKSEGNRLIGGYTSIPFSKTQKKRDEVSELFAANICKAKGQSQREDQQRQFNENQHEQEREEQRQKQEEQEKIQFVHYEVSKPDLSIEYADYFIIFGNSDFRLKNGETKLFSNLGIVNTYYGKKQNGKWTEYLGVEPKIHQVTLTTYEIYQLQYEREK